MGSGEAGVVAKQTVLNDAASAHAHPSTTADKSRFGEVEQSKPFLDS